MSAPGGQRWARRRARCWSPGRPPATGRRPTGDRGSATVAVLAAVLVLTVAGGTALLLAEAVLARHRAEGAADLAALAAAGRVLDGAGTACAVAERVAAANGGRLQRCSVHGDQVEVLVTVRPGRLLARAGTATAAARAGPVGTATPDEVQQPP